MSGETTTVAVRGDVGRQDDPDEPAVGPVLTALADEDCRAILRAIGTGSLTANECSERCDLPLSTTYRKLERLAGADLLTERIRIREDGKHASQYRRDFGGLRLDVEDGGDLSIAVADRGADSAPG